MKTAAEQEAQHVGHKVFVQQLYREYQEICYQYRLSLSAVVIQIRPLASKWGEWDSLTRCITLSERLVVEQPWHIVLEIFKHEMAHQLVQETWGQQEYHGPYFQLACERLGMAAWARKATVTQMDSFLDSQDTSVRQSQTIRRIQKLLQLSSSTNPHEAAAALQKAKELSLAYQVEVQSTASHSDFHVRIINHRRKRLETFHTLLASILVEHFHVEAIFIQLFDREFAENVKAMEIIGAAHHVEIAEYVYWFLFQQLQSLWDEEIARNKSQGRNRPSFYLGVLHGFSEKLRKKQNSSTTKEDALLVISQKQSKQALACRFPRLRTQKTRSSISDVAAYQQGCKKGTALELRAGLTKKNTGCGGFLTERKL